MSRKAFRLSNGNIRGRVRDPRTGKQVSPHTVIGGPRSYRTIAERDEAQRKAREVLLDPNSHLTVRQWYEMWTTSELYGAARGRSPETVIHRAERTSHFVAVYGDELMRSIDRTIALDWLSRGHRSQIPQLCTMFNDARRDGKIPWDCVPFNEMGLATPTRRGRKLPTREDIDRMHAIADEHTPPSFAAWLFIVSWQGIRPGEADALKWDDINFDRNRMMIDEQWSKTGGRFKEPKHGSIRNLPMVPMVAERLAELPRESEFCFTTVTGKHYTPSTRQWHWNRVRCLSGLEGFECYLATRHFFVTYAIEVLGLSPRDIGKYCGHRNGDEIVNQHYLHPDDEAHAERVEAKLARIKPAPRRLKAV